MIGTSLDFSGLLDLSEDLATLSKAENRKVMRDATRAGATIFKDEAVSRAPVKTGKLKKNIVVLTQRERNGAISSGVHIRGTNPRTGASDKKMKATRDIVAAAVRCLDAVWKDGHRYQKGGILLGDFFSQGVAQLNLFDDTAPRENAKALMDILDSVNQRNGRGTLFFAGQGIEKKWQMKREMLSPRWTTRLTDVPRVF